MKKEGYQPATIKDRTNNSRIGKLGIPLLDADRVKEWVANLAIKSGCRLNIFKAYSCYSKSKGVKFQFPLVSNTEPDMSMEKIKE